MGARGIRSAGDDDEINGGVTGIDNEFRDSLPRGSLGDAGP